MQHTFLSRFGRIVPIASAAVVSMTLSAQMAAPPQAAGPLRQGAAQTSAQQPQIQAASLNAEFTKGIDTKKAKTGDEVNAKTTADARLPDGTDLPKGTRLAGNVVEVTPKSKERKNSHLVFSLNRAVTKEGKEVPIHAAVTSVTGPAMAQSLDMPSPSSGGMTPSSSSGSGSTPAPAPSRSMPTSSVSSDAPAQQAAMLKSAQDRVPVANMPDVVLSAPTTPESAGVLDAQNQNINITSGTKFTVNVSPSHAGQGGA